ncbi:MAG: GT4 family glycosyltransferase PelF [Acidimicrobiia bacterium]
MSDHDRPSSRLKVLLTAEGTYPHTVGGVSTWCQSLIEELPEVDFTVFAHMTNPFVKENYKRPPNADLIGVPIWGVEEPAEFNPKLSPRRVLVLSAMMDEATARRRFCPLLTELLLMVTEPHRYDAERFGQILYEMYRYFRNHDFRGTFRTRAVWETFRTVVLDSLHMEPTDDEWEEVAPEANPTPQEIMQRLGQLRRDPRNVDPDATASHRVPRLFEATESMRVLYRLLTPLNYEIPDADVVHATAASFCGLAGIVRKIESGTPFLVTEHGVFMREQMLFLGRIGFPYHLRRFFIQFVSAVSRSVYHYADQVSPVCSYNARWERVNGATEEKIRVIYNGVDSERFRPREVERPDAPTVVLVARVDPLKDMETALRVAARVREVIPNVRFRHFGPAPDQEYMDKCQRLWEELELQETFEWMGSTRDAPGAYNQADVVLLTSISEAFPYTVIEAMMCGKPVVSTNVGGVPEAVADLGDTARIRDVEGLAQGVIELLEQSPEEKARLSSACRERTLELFALDRSINAYRDSYRELAAQERRPLPRLVPVASPAAWTAEPTQVEAGRRLPASPQPLPTGVTPLPIPFVAPAASAVELQQMLRSPTAQVRLTAIASVAELLDTESALSALTHALSADPDVRIRTQAAVELGDLLGVAEVG